MSSETPSPPRYRTDQRPLARVTLAQAAADAVREMIMVGELPVGTRIRQRELAAELQVSRTPMREALSKLASEGLIGTDPSGQAVVCRPSVEELEELYEIRESLEGLAAVHAAERRQPQDVERLRRIISDIDRTESADEWVRLNAEFHSTLYGIARRGELLKLIDSLRRRDRGLREAPRRGRQLDGRPARTRRRSSTRSRPATRTRSATAWASTSVTRATVSPP